MLNGKKLTIHVFGHKFEAPEEYLSGWVFCMTNGNVFVSGKKPIRESFCWDLRNIKFVAVGTLPHQITTEEATESIKPLKDYLDINHDGSWEAAGAIEEGCLYTWGIGATAYLRANDRVYLIEPHYGSLVDVGPVYEYHPLTSDYPDFRYVSSWGVGNNKSSD